MAQCNLSTTSPIHSRKVAVIGAGPAGLVAACELVREGHKVVVLEKDNQIGGTWVYTDQVESDPLGVDPDRAIVHSSLYMSVRTLPPREMMGFKQYPFVRRKDGSGDPRMFPLHVEVLTYLKEFAREFGIEETVRLQTEVVNVGLVENNKWKVRSKTRHGYCYEEIYDAVVVCVGHNTCPRIAEIPGINSWPGKQMHSHNYRIPEPFRDQVVIIIGNSASAFDISRDIAGVAKEIHLASRSVADETYEKQAGFHHIWQNSMIQSARKDGTVIFRNGKVVHADIILHCTGYKYNFPFLDTNGNVTVEEKLVEPLYKHIFPPGLAPWLSFVGVPWEVVPFPMFEFQSKWIAGVLSGRIHLPSQDEMMEDIKSYYSALEASGTPKRYTHNLCFSQFDYNDWLAGECGCEGVEQWRKQMFFAVCELLAAKRDTYRDAYESEPLILKALEDFTEYTSKQNSN